MVTEPVTLPCPSAVPSVDCVVWDPVVGVVVVDEAEVVFVAGAVVDVEEVELVTVVEVVELVEVVVAFVVEVVDPLAGTAVVVEVGFDDPSG